MPCHDSLLSPDNSEIVEFLSAYGEGKLNVSVSFAFCAVLNESIRDYRNGRCYSVFLFFIFLTSNRVDQGVLSVTSSQLTWPVYSMLILILGLSFDVGN